MVISSCPRRASSRITFSGIFAFLVMLISGDSIVFAQQTKNVSPAGTKFLLYTPPGYSPTGGPYPLLVSLHGQVGIGDDLDAILASPDQTPAKLIHLGKWPAHYPFIVASPQIKHDPSIPDNEHRFSPALVDEVIEHIKSAYAVDGERIYAAGLSLGATGVWTYAAAYPEKVAAMVPISGVPDSTQGCKVKDVPAWVFHGEWDGLVRPVFATGMVNAINDCTPPGEYVPHLTILNVKKHTGWNEIYNNTSNFHIYDWLLLFSKNDHSNKPPYVNAGADVRILDRDLPLHLYGEYFDSDGSISTVSWTQTGGPAVTLQNTDTRFLRISNLVPGVLEFRLSATDDVGKEQSDLVKVEVLDQAGSLPAVTDLVLVNAETGVDIGKMRDGYVINPDALGTNRINIRAVASSSSFSVRLRVNSDHNLNTPNTPGPYVLTRHDWRIQNGKYLVCVTPFDDRAGRGNEGISQCYQVIVSTEIPPDDDPVDDPTPDEPAPPTHFYSLPNKELSTLDAWNSKRDGSGVAPESFSTDGQTFEVVTTAVLNNPLLPEGAVFKVTAGGSLFVNNNLGAAIDLEGNAALTVNTSHPVHFGSLSPDSFVTLESLASLVPRADYGTLRLKGTVKTLAAGNTKVMKTLTVDDGVVLTGAPGADGTLSLHGPVHLDEQDRFEAAGNTSLIFAGGAEQNLFVRGTEVFLDEMTIATGTRVLVINETQIVSIHLGSEQGGGLAVSNDGVLSLGKNNLIIDGQGTINSAGQTGRIAFRGSALSINSGTELHSHVYVVPASDTIQSLVSDLTGNGSLIIHDPLFITDHIASSQGQVMSDGNIALVSASGKTAIVKPGSGQINGDIQFQRLIEKGERIRYLSFPLSGVTASEIQSCIPVTGNADGGTHSWFQFDDQHSEWRPFPESSNAETFVIGKGYSFGLPDAEVRLVATGTLHNGEFSFPLTSNPSNDPDKGWNLIGNPYAAPIRWSPSTWASSGVSTAAYVLDDRYPGGRFLVWDGETGDEEFGGWIGQGQGFFVRTVDANPLLQLNESASADTSLALFRAKSTFDQLTIDLRRDELVDKAYIKFQSEGNDGLDLSDAVKRKNGYFSLFTLSSDSVALAINSLSDSLCGRAVGIALDAPPGTYRMEFSGDIFDAGQFGFELIDRFSGITVDLGADAQYEFDVTPDAASSGAGRFAFLFTSREIGQPEIAIEGTMLISSAASGNQWFLNGNAILGATDATYQPLVSGEYSVGVSSMGCISMSSPVTFVVTGTMDPVPGIALYPNPASGYIRVTGHESTDLPFVILTATGKAVLSGMLPPAGNTIDISDLRPGLYFLVLPHAGRTVRRKIMVH